MTINIERQKSGNASNFTSQNVIVITFRNYNVSWLIVGLNNGAGTMKYICRTARS